jgi:5'-nucleotidase
MPYDLSKRLVIAISSRALFNLERENRIFDEQGLEAYSKFQLAHESEILSPGVGFPLVKYILKLNELLPEHQRPEVLIVSRNNADTSLRIYSSAQHYGLDITRGAFTSGEPVAKYLQAFYVDLFLSASEEDVAIASAAGIPAGLVLPVPESSQFPIDQLKIALDGDAVLFSEESERIYKEAGLEAFLEHEKKNARKPLPEGPFAKLFKTVSFLQQELAARGMAESPIRTALITARNAPAHERVIRTLREWGVRVDEAFFLGGVSKDRILERFQPHIYFDDQALHCDPASRIVPTARVLSTAQNPPKRKEHKVEQIVFAEIVNQSAEELEKQRTLDDWELEIRKRVREAQARLRANLESGKS